MISPKLMREIRDQIMGWGFGLFMIMVVVYPIYYFIAEVTIFEEELPESQISNKDALVILDNLKNEKSTYSVELTDGERVVIDNQLREYAETKKKRTKYE